MPIAYTLGSMQTQTSVQTIACFRFQTAREERCVFCFAYQPCAAADCVNWQAASLLDQSWARGCHELGKLSTAISKVLGAALEP